MNVCLNPCDTKWDTRNPKSCHCLPSTFIHSFVPNILPCAGAQLPFHHTGTTASVSPLNSTGLQKVNPWKARLGCAVPQATSGQEWLVVAGPVAWTPLRRGVIDFDRCSPLPKCTSRPGALDLHVHPRHPHRVLLFSLVASCVGNRIITAIT